MSPIDELTLALLRSAYGSDDEPAKWFADWQIESQGNTSFVEYLSGRGVFTQDAPKTIALVSKGYLQIEGRSLLSSNCTTSIIEDTSNRDSGPGSSSVSLGSQQTTTIAQDQTRVIPRENDPRRTPVSLPETVQGKLLPETKPAISAWFEIGSKIGRCVLLRELGEGGAGTVFEAMHSGLGIRVAVKVLRGADRGSRAQESLRTEARLLARLNHVNLVRVFDYDDDGPVPYLVMELVEGLNLGDLIAQSGGLRPDKALRIILESAQGLAAAHEVGIVHRDIKPNNILLDRTGRVKVADLGLAVSRLDGLAIATGVQSAERAGGGGTVAYMAPERFGGTRGVDFRSDIYSLGVTFFESLAGRLPYSGVTPMEVMVQHASAPIPELHLIRRGVPAAYSFVVNRMMAKSPTDRFDSYADLIATLQTLLTSTPAEPSVPPTEHKTPKTLASGPGSGFIGRLLQFRGKPPA